MNLFDLYALLKSSGDGGGTGGAISLEDVHIFVGDYREFSTQTIIYGDINLSNRTLYTK